MNDSINVSEKEAVILDAIIRPAAVVDSAGNLLYENDAWRSNSHDCLLFGKMVSEGNYFDYCERAVSEGNDYALKLIIGLRKVLDGVNQFQFTFFTGAGSCKKWYNGYITSLSDGGAIIQYEDVTDSVTLSETLRDSEERYRQHFEHSLDGIIIATSEGDIIEVNDAACSLLGYSKKEIIEGGRELIVDTDHPGNIEADKFRKEKSFFKGEKVYRHKSGKEIYVEVSSVIYRDMNGRNIHMNTFRDVTEKNEIRRKLDEQLQFSETAMNSVPGIFYVINDQMKFVRWNEAFYTEMGYSDEELSSLTPGELIHEDDRQRILDKIQSVFETGKPEEALSRVYTKNRGIRHYKTNATRFDGGDDTYIVGTSIDVTDLVESEREREKTYALMRQLFENSPLGIVMVNAQGEVERANQGFVQMFGYSDEELTGQGLDVLITTEKELADAKRISASAFTGKVYQEEGLRYTKDGKKVPVLINSIPVKSNGHITSIYGIYVNLTQQKDLEEQITTLLDNEKVAREELEKTLEIKEILLQEVHHRVKNNLALIAGLIDLQMMDESNEEVNEKLTQVHGRIFSIAKIHETLYQEKNVTSINADDYIVSFFSAYSKTRFSDSQMPVNFNLTNIELNLNQAVPFGLLLNELMSILLTDVQEYSDPISISLCAHDDGLIHLNITGKCLNICNLFSNRDSDKFQFAILKILLVQLGAKFEESVTARGVCVNFKKMNLKGSSSSFVQKLNI